MTSSVKKTAAAASASLSKVPPLWKWGIGASAVAVASAVYNAARARQAEAGNPPLGKFLEVAGLRLHYLERGEGPPVVLFHGNGTMIEDMLASGLLDELAQTNRVIAFDRPGFGHSDRPRSVIWTPAAQARLFAEALQQLNVGAATIVGHSFGTMVAAALALDHAALVSRLVLIGGYYYPTLRVDAAMAAPAAIPVIGDAIRYTVSPLLGAAMKPVAERQMFAPAAVSSGWRTSFPFEMTLRPSQVRASSAEAAMMVPAAASMASRLGELEMPVAIIAGKGDKIVDPEAQSVRLHAELAHSELILVEGAGHMVHHTATETVAKAVRKVSAGS